MHRVETISSHVGFRRLCHVRQCGDAAIITLHHELLNALTVDMRAAVLHCFNEAERDDSVRCIVMVGEGGAFSCGIDVVDFAASAMDTTRGDGATVPSLSSLTSRVEGSRKVVIAAIQGVAFSGGLELALAAHYRVATSNSVFCMPEVKLGIVPCGGGTQRLPRLIGMRAALDMITTGRKVSAAEALRLGLIDRLASSGGEGLLETVLQLSGGWSGPRRISCDSRRLGNKVFNSIFLRYVGSEISKKKPKNVVAPLLCLQAVRAAMTSSSFEEGLAEEMKMFNQSLQSPEAHAMQHLLRSSYRVLRETLPMLPAKPGTGLQQQRFRKIAVVGCGTLGTGVAIMALRTGVPVVVFGRDPSECKFAFHAIKLELANTSAERSASITNVKSALLENLSVLTYDEDPQVALRDVDMMMWCVVGNSDHKRQMFTKLGDFCPPRCVLATCCSSLMLRDVANMLRRPERVVGMYFAPPVHSVPFLEVTRGERTDHTTLQQAIHAGRLFHKATILSRDVGLSVTSRIFLSILYQALSMVEQGAFPADVDRAMRHFGFRLGVFAMEDLAELQVIDQMLSIVKAQECFGVVRSPCPSADVFTIHRRLMEKGRLGQRTGRGWYTYEGGNRLPLVSAWRRWLVDYAWSNTEDSYGVWRKGGASLTRRPYRDRAVELLILGVCREKKIMRRDISRREIVERILFAATNEAAMLLREGIVTSASAIDVVTAFGHGFPAWRGGLCYYADKFGLPNVVHRMRIYNKSFGDTVFPPPCDELLQMAGSQQTFGSMWP